MKITLYMATSVDGFIAKRDGDSDWVSEVDTVNFEKKINEMGCIVVGNRTFEQYKGELYPVSGVTNIVLTANPSNKTESENCYYAKSPSEAVEIAKQKGHDKILLIGGGITNGMFLTEGVVDEVILCVHPLVLGDGIKLFEDTEQQIDLEFLNQKKLGEGLIQIHYKVKKS